MYWPVQVQFVPPTVLQVPNAVQGQLVHVLQVACAVQVQLVATTCSTSTICTLLVHTMYQSLYAHTVMQRGAF
jgi:hypothetical protein